MGADQWSKCPRCLKQATVVFENLVEVVNDMYGKVPVQEFDRARANLEAEREKLENYPETWREDFEVTGAEDGVVNVKYRGSCRVCNLRTKFDHNHVILEN